MALRRFRVRAPVTPRKGNDMILAGPQVSIGFDLSAWGGPVGVAGGVLTIILVLYVAFAAGRRARRKDQRTK